MFEISEVNSKNISETYAAARCVITSNDVAFFRNAFINWFEHIEERAVADYIGFGDETDISDKYSLVFEEGSRYIKIIKNQWTGIQ